MLDFNGTNLKISQIITTILGNRSLREGQNYNLTVVSGQLDIWIPKYVFNLHQFNYTSYYSTKGLENIKDNAADFLLVVDNDYKNRMNQENKLGDLKSFYDNSLIAARIKQDNITPLASNHVTITDIRTSWISSFSSIQ